MYTKILVPLDGSRFSEEALSYARTLAKEMDVPIELFQAVDPRDLKTVGYPEWAGPNDAAEAELVRRSDDYLEHVAGLLGKSLMVQYSAALGEPAELIIERAASRSGTLVAMATRGHSGMKRWLLGSVADKVLRGGKSTLLLVRPREESRVRADGLLRRALVPLDGSEAAETVLPHVTAIARAMRLEVVLLRVWTLPKTAYVPAEYRLDLLQTARERLRDEAREYLEGKLAELKDSGVEDVSYGVLHGEPADEIIDMARQTPAALVAMCSHGRSGLGRWLLGSVADRVVRHSGDPVLVVPLFGERVQKQRHKPQEPIAPETPSLDSALETQPSFHAKEHV